MTLGNFTICQQSRSFTSSLFEILLLSVQKGFFIEEALREELQNIYKFSKMFSAMSLICKCHHCDLQDHYRDLRDHHCDLQDHHDRRRYQHWNRDIINNITNQDIAKQCWSVCHDGHDDLDQEINILCNGVGWFAATRRDGLQCLGWAAPPTRSSMFSSSWL